MKKNNKNKEQLLIEIEELNSKIADLEKLKSERNRPLVNMLESEQNFKALVESARDGIIVIQDDIIKFANPHAYKIYGASLNNVIGQSFIKFVHPDSVEMIKKRYTDWRSGKKVPNYFQVDLINSNKEKRVCEINSSTIVFDGQPSELVIVHDITERSQAEEKLKQSEENFRGLFNSVTDAIYIQDNEGRFLDVNEGAVKMYGYPKEFFIGKTPEPLSAPGKNDLNKIGKHIEKAFKGEPQIFEFWGLRSNGEVFPKIVRLQKGKYFEKDVLIAIAMDITERKQAEEKLINRNKELELFNEVTVGRELKMIELKKEINELLEKSGKKPKYEIPT